MFSTESRTRQQNPSSCVVLHTKIIFCVHHNITLSVIACFHNYSWPAVCWSKRKLRKNIIFAMTPFLCVAYSGRDLESNPLLSFELYYVLLLLMFPLIMTQETDVFACISINFSELQNKPHRIIKWLICCKSMAAITTFSYTITQYFISNRSYDRKKHYFQCHLKLLKKTKEENVHGIQSFWFYHVLLQICVGLKEAISKVKVL